MRNQHTSAFPFPSYAYQNGEINHGEGGMTLREYAAIALKVPASGTKWLDEMIEQSLRNDIAANAMQGLLKVNRPTDIGGLRQEWANEAYLLADAMRKASKGGAA